VDSDGTLHKEFDVIGEKTAYGRKLQGVIRSTFLLNPEGNILKEWRNVRATGHAEKVARELGVM
jgi:peroxiredoxin Q/BCP